MADHQAVFAQGTVVHDPAGGAVSRLYAKRDYLGAGAGAAAGRMLATDPERLGAGLRLHGQVRHQRRDRRWLGRGGGAVERHMVGFPAAYARRGIKLELGERLTLGYQFHIASSREQAIREAAPHYE